MGERHRTSATRLLAQMPEADRQHATFDTDQSVVDEGVTAAAQHRAISKWACTTPHIERCNTTLRQRVARRVREAWSFAKKLASASLWRRLAWLVMPRKAGRTSAYPRGLHGPAEARVELRTVGIGPRKARVEPDRLAQVDKRLLELACLAQCQGATAQGERVRRVPLQRGAIRRNGLAKVPELCEQSAHIDMRHRIGRISGRRRAQAFQALAR